MQNEIQKLIRLAQDGGIEPFYQTGNIACAFVGEWNSGKTSVINVLTDIELPVKPIPTTKTVVLLRRSSSPEIAVTHKDGNIERATGDEAFLLAEKYSPTDVRKIEYGDPDINIPEDVVFIDTPGFNDQDAVSNTKAESSNADVIVFVLQGAGAVLGQKQQEFIEQAIVAKGNQLSDLLFLITHSDMIPEKEEREDILARFLTMGHERLQRDQFHFVSLKDGAVAGVDEFQKSLYAKLEERKASLLPDRTRRLIRQLKGELKQAVARKRELMRYQQEEGQAKAGELKNKLAEARIKERNKREQIRLRYQEKADEFEKRLSSVLDVIEAELEVLVDGLSELELKAKGRIEREIAGRISEKIDPLVNEISQELGNGLAKDFRDAEEVSCSLVNALNLDLPQYTPRGPKLSAEAILPLAVIGTLITTGVFSIPFLVVGIATVYADKLGLTGKGSYLDLAVQKAKSLGVSAHKRAVKSAIASSLGEYRWKLKNALSVALEKVIEQQFERISYVKQIEQDLRSVLSDTGIAKTRMWIDEVEGILQQLDGNSSIAHFAGEDKK